MAIQFRFLCLIVRCCLNYSKTRETYILYRKSGYSKRFLEEHKEAVLIHKAAKKAFDDLGIKKLPAVKDLQAEWVELQKHKRELYDQYRNVRAEMRELLIHKSNVEQILELGHTEKRNDREQLLR